MPAPFPLVRDVPALKARRYDLLVIGGGIYGAWTAYDAALRGLSVALVEKDDWAAGTSSASSKLIHGGLRYLEHFEFALVRHALVERRKLARLAPHLVRPLNFVLPVWKGARVGPFQLSAGLMLYDLLAFGRQPVQRHKHYRRERLLRRYPFLAPDGLRGGFRYGDCQEDDARLALTVVAAAQGAGAAVANRVAAESLIQDERGVHGARLRDAETGGRFELRAAVTVTATGPWTGKLLGPLAPRMKLVKGTHLVLPAIPDCHSAFLLTAPQDGRVFFVIPWYGRTLVGTTESEVPDADGVQPTEGEERYLLGAVNAWMPALGWTPGEVLGRFCGVRSLQAQQTDNLSAVTREFAIEQPRHGLVVPIGGKYTTARCDSALIVDRVQQALRRAVTPATTDRAPLPGAPEGDFAHWQGDMLAQLGAAGLAPDTAQSLAQRYGTRCARVLDLLGENPAWGERLHPQTPFIAAEAVLAQREEMARGLEDAIRRRMPLRLLARLDPARLDRIAALIAG
ncbi:MAG: glycerol-3-phosphate dehydrogenase/oxidase [Gammaproteobacteria bacterium]|nr:glycerol-3-phosphate dehydrogenase/oxidase [Gammaproteobacteria bacterium]